MPKIQFKGSFKVLEAVFLILVFSISLSAVSDIFGQRIAHDFPYGYYASDGFWHQVVSQYVKETGNYKTQPPYMSRGFEDVVGFNPPILYQLAPVFSYASGLEVYDTIYLLVMLFIILGFFLFYLINKKFNKGIAILSAPLFIFVFAKSFHVAFTWGQWIFVAGSFFLIAFFWSISNIELNKSWLIIGIFLAALALSHTSEFIFAAGFIIFYLALKFLLTRKIEGIELKKIIAAGIIAFILSAYYLIIFVFTWGKQGYQFSVNVADAGFKLAWLSDFGPVLIIMAAGLIFWLFIVKKAYSAILAIPVYMLIIGYTNYIGFEHRAFQTRFFWPVYLSIFIGMALYYPLRFLLKKWALVASVFASILLIISFKALFYQKISSNGIMDPYHWQALSWISENTPKNSKVYYFYGDQYSQNALLWDSKRMPILVNANSFIESLNNRTIKRVYYSKFASASDNGFPYRNGLFSFGYHSKDQEIKKSSDMDICQFDYFVFDKAASQQVLVQYNLLIRDQLLKNDFISEVFNNEVVSILVNKKPGADCINEQRIA